MPADVTECAICSITQIAGLSWCCHSAQIHSFFCDTVAVTDGACASYRNELWRCRPRVTVVSVACTTCEVFA